MPKEKHGLPTSTNGHRTGWASRWRRLRGFWNGASPGPEPLGMYVRLAVQLALDRPPGERAKSILLTSPTSEDLIRDTGREFAYVLAHEMGRRVLLIESDFGRAGDREAPGVTDLLVHGVDGLPGAVRPTGHRRVFTLPVGSPHLAPASFAGGRHAELIAQACASYDSVILIGAPVLRDPKSLLFAPLVDHSLLVAVEGGTYVSELETSLRVLNECKAAGVGVVLAKGQGDSPPRGGGGKPASRSTPP